MRIVMLACCCSSYRTREQIQEVRQKRDPITGFKDRVISCGLMTAEEIKVFQRIITLAFHVVAFGENGHIFLNLFIYANHTYGS